MFASKSVKPGKALMSEVMSFISGQEYRLNNETHQDINIKVGVYSFTYLVRGGILSLHFEFID